MQNFNKMITKNKPLTLLLIEILTLCFVLIAIFALKRKDLNALLLLDTLLPLSLQVFTSGIFIKSYNL